MCIWAKRKTSPTAQQCMLLLLLEHRRQRGRLRGCQLRPQRLHQPGLRGRELAEAALQQRRQLHARQRVALPPGRLQGIHISQLSVLLGTGQQGLNAYGTTGGARQSRDQGVRC